MVSIRSATDYSPFGVQLENRNFLKAGLAEDFRMGFQGQEEDDEVKGEGNSVNYKYRMHDPRLGRFFAVDPLIKDYPHYSSYGFSGNIVIHNVELEGLENIYYWEKDQSGNWVRIDDWVDVQSNLDENINCYLYSYPNGGVEKAVYKSINQGGKDRWEHNGGLAPRDILSAHYDHDKGPSVNKSFDKTRPMMGEGGANAADGQKKQTAKDYKYAAATIVTILTVGQGAAALTAGELTYSAGAKLAFDLGANSDNFLNYTEDWSPEAKNVFNAVNMFSAGFSIREQIVDVATMDKGFEFYNTAGNLVGTLQIVDGAMQLSGGNDFIQTFYNILNDKSPIDKE